MIDTKKEIRVALIRMHVYYSDHALRQAPISDERSDLYRKWSLMYDDVTSLARHVESPRSTTFRQIGRWAIAAPQAVSVMRYAIELSGWNSWNDLGSPDELASRTYELAHDLEVEAVTRSVESANFWSALKDRMDEGYFERAALYRTEPDIEPSAPSQRTPLPPDLRDGAWLKTNGLCWYCGIQTLPSSFSVDHIHPVADGGSNDPDNLVPCCKPCNSAKHAMPLEMFRRRRGGGLFWFELRSEGI